MVSCIAQTDHGLCGKPATINQAGGFACVDHATDRAALHARFDALDANPLSDDREERYRALAERGEIEFRIRQLAGLGP